MAVSDASQIDGSATTPGFPDEALIEELERIPEPAVLYLPGGRIAAVNGVATRLPDLPVVGMSVLELLRRYDVYHADGSPLVRGELPFARALRGEVVDHGERIDIALPGGVIYRSLVTSAPIVRDGKVVAALSVFHDFDVYARRLIDGGSNGPGRAPLS